MTPEQTPDPLARLLAHAVVGIGVGYLLSKRAGGLSVFLGSAITIIAHEKLDAPLAQIFSENGF
jgi:hypothetical protein